MAHTNRDRAIKPAKQLRRIIRRELSKLRRMMAEQAGEATHASS